MHPYIFHLCPQHQNNRFTPKKLRCSSKKSVYPINKNGLLLDDLNQRQINVVSGDISSHKSAGYNGYVSTSNIGLLTPNSTFDSEHSIFDDDFQHYSFSKV